MDRILRLGAGGLPGVGQVRKMLLVDYFENLKVVLCVKLACHFVTNVIFKLFLFLFRAIKTPPTDAPIVDTAEQVYISSLALLKV